MYLRPLAEGHSAVFHYCGVRKTMIKNRTFQYKNGTFVWPNSFTIFKNILMFFILNALHNSCYADISLPIITDYKPNGLAIGTPNTLTQGKNTLWLGGEDGLFAITGSVTVHYSANNNAFSDSEILDILEDANGKVWLGTDGAGIDIFDPMQKTTKNLSVTQGLSSNLVQRLVTINDSLIAATTFNGIALIDINTYEVNNLFTKSNDNDFIISSTQVITTDSKGTIYFTQGSDSFYSYHHPSATLKTYSKNHSNIQGSKIFDILLDTSNPSTALWILTDKGLNKLGQQNTVLDFYPVLDETIDNSTGNTNSKLYKDELGRMWIIGKSLYQLDTNQQEISKVFATSQSKSNFEIQNIKDISIGNNGELYILSENSGLVTIPQVSNAMSILHAAQGLPIGTVRRTAKLSHQTLAIIGIEKLYLLDPKTIETIDTSELGQVVESVRFSEYELLLATRRGKLLLFDTSNKTTLDITERFAGLSITDKNLVHQIMKQDDGSFLITLRGNNNSGLYKGKLNQNFSLIFPGYVEHIVEDIDGTLIIATRDGIFQQQKDVRRLSKDSRGLETTTIFALKNWFEWEDSKDRINYVHNCLRKDQQGKIWLCTSGDGLAYLDTNSSTIQYIAQELTADSAVIRDIINDRQGYYWITTDRGLVRYDGKKQSSTIVDVNMGLFDVDFESDTSALFQTNHLFIAGTKNNYSIDVTQLNQYLNNRSQRKTKLIVNELYTHSGKQNAKRNLLIETPNPLQNPNDFLSLEHNEYLLTFEFSTHNYLEKNTLNYEYRMRGLSEEWLSTIGEQNQASYITLPPAEYIFEARVVDKNSFAKQPIVKMNVVVHPAPWYSWPAYTAYFVIGILFVYFVFRYRTWQLRIANAELELAVKQRTSQLKESNKQVSDLLQKKQSFFTNVSHEFRTPLSLILGPLGFLLDNIEDPKLKQQVSLINRNARRLNQMVDQILDLAKLDEAKTSQQKFYSIGQSLRVITQPFVTMAEMREQTLTIHLNAEGYVEMHEDALDRIVSNLLSNAIKFTPEHGNITFTAENVNNDLIMTVKDDGIGIDSAFHNAIFERFTRVDGSEDVPGSGIGLSLVKELIENNKGTIKVISNHEKGTSFVALLPLTDQVQQNKVSLIKPSRLNFSAEPASDNTIPDLAKSANNKHVEIILIVEDNPDMRHFIVEGLSENYRCVTAANGKQGIEQAITCIPDLIISDVMMPISNGFELSQKIREHQATSHIPIILLTAKGDNESRVYGWNLDIDDYVAKPFDFDELKARISRLLAIRKIVKNKYSRKIELAIGQENNGELDVSFANTNEQQFFETFIQVIAKNHKNESFNRAEASELMAIGERQLNRKLGALVDCNFSEYLRKYRLSKAKLHLQSGMQITECSYAVGFSSPSYFSSCFKKEFGISPKMFIAQKRDN
jgi:signal transduction histidine kinase/DNA-binding response OmpR family regulator/ligand-binding sensor domain-containing protein